MGKRELKNETLSTEEVYKVINFIVFGISNNFISRNTPSRWEKIIDDFFRCKNCNVTYFKRTKSTNTNQGNVIISQNGEDVIWQGFSTDELTSPSCGRDVCWSLGSYLASFLEAIYEFKINHL